MGGPCAHLTGHGSGQQLGPERSGSSARACAAVPDAGSAGREPQQLRSPFGTNTYDIGGVVVSANDVGTIAVALGIVVLLWLLFQFTKVGLALRAAAVNP